MIGYHNQQSQGAMIDKLIIASDPSGEEHIHQVYIHLNEEKVGVYPSYFKQENNLGQKIL